MTVILVAHVLIAAVLIVVVLMQQSEGGALGIGGGGGGGGAGGMMTGRGVAGAMVKATMVLGALFFVTSLGLTVITGGQTERASQSATELEINEREGETGPAVTEITPPDDAFRAGSDLLGEGDLTPIETSPETLPPNTDGQTEPAEDDPQ